MTVLVSQNYDFAKTASQTFAMISGVVLVVFDRCSPICEASVT